LFEGIDTVLELDRQAYHARLTLDGPDILLATTGELYRLRLNQPLKKLEKNFGSQLIFGEKTLIYWDQGWFFRASKQGENPIRWFKESSEPLELAAAGDSPVWVVRGDNGKFIVRSRMATGTVEAYSGESRIVTLATQGQHAFFVEAAPGDTFRFVSIALSKAKTDPIFSPRHSGRTPAMLMPGQGELFYYAGLSGGVRSIRADFSEEKLLQKGWICSPLTAFENRVFCASVDGVGSIDLQKDNSSARWQKLQLRGPITALAASRTHLAWLTDSGKDHLTLEVGTLRVPTGSDAPVLP
jgi:hypothetical protein